MEGEVGIDPQIHGPIADALSVTPRELGDRNRKAGVCAGSGFEEME